MLPHRPPDYQPLGEGEGDDQVDFSFEGMKRMKDTVIDKALDNSDRRELGKGMMGDLLNREYRMDRMNSEIQTQMDELDDHRSAPTAPDNI